MQPAGWVDLRRRGCNMTQREAPYDSRSQKHLSPLQAKALGGKIATEQLGLSGG